MSSVRNMEEYGGKRDEGQRLNMGPRGTISGRPKLVAISGRGVMCTYALRGLKKDRVSFSLPSLFDHTLAFRLPIMMSKSRFGTFEMSGNCSFPPHLLH